jgi:uncharacterized protein (DUF433 family)
MPATANNYVYLKPKRGYKQLFVLGRIPTWTFHTWNQGEDAMSVEELAADFNVPVEAVREAIAYCESKPPEMKEDRRREEAWMEAMGMNDPNYKWNPHPRIPSWEEIARLNKL